MAVLTKRASSKAPFRWEGTEERAFRETQRIGEEFRERHRVVIKYRRDKPLIYLVTDASLTGTSGFVSQGEDWRTAPVAAFWSGKFNSGQQNYSVTDREALAIIVSLEKFGPMLHGVRFEILTDHRALEHLMTQKNLSARQARWLDALSQFDFKIKYIEGTTNVFADALLRIYSDKAKGTVQARSEYVPEEKSDEEMEDYSEVGITRPVLAGLTATVAQESQLTSEGVRRNPTLIRTAPRRYDPEIPGIVPDGTKTKRTKRRKQTAIGGPISGEQVDRWGESARMDEGDVGSPLGVELEGEKVPHEDTQTRKQTGTDPRDQSDARNLTNLVTKLTC